MPGLDQTVVVEYDAEEAWPTLQSTPKLEFQDLSHLSFHFVTAVFLSKKRKGGERGKEKKGKKKGKKK